MKAAAKHTSFGPADIEGVWLVLQETVLQEAAEGNKVNTSLFNLGQRIRGKFLGPLDSFDDSRHTLLPAISAGLAVRRLFESMQSAVKVSAQKRDPEPQQLRDVATEKVNETLTAAGVAELRGERLQVADPDDEEQGVFFLPQGASTIVRSPKIITNLNSSLLFMVPADLPAGAWTLAVRTRTAGGSLLSGRLSFTISSTAP